VDCALARIPHEGLSWQKVMLFKGKVLRRLGRKEEGDAIFADAYKDKWPQYQYENERSLLELRDFSAVARQEFERVSGRMNGSLYQVPFYTAGIEDLGLFKIYLNRLKVNQPETSAIESVYAPLAKDQDVPFMLGMAKALCLSADGLIAEAKKSLEEAETQFASEKDDPAVKDIPLYKAMILIDEGNDIAGAQAEFRRFMENHGSDWHIIYSGGVRFTRSMEEISGQRQFMDEITTLLINSPILQDESVKTTFSDYDLAHLFDLYQSGLTWSGRNGDAVKICQYVIATFTLNNLPAANCAATLAGHLYSQQNDPDAALALLENISVNAPFDAIMPWVRLTQAEITMKKGMRFQAFNFVQDAISRTIINDGGVQSEGLKNALKMQQSILTN
jgi:tetratricopeptide (TPR) repeat protein